VLISNVSPFSSDEVLVDLLLVM